MEFLNDVDRNSGFKRLSQFLVNPDNVDELVSQIVLRPDPRLQSYRGSDRDGRDWHDLENSPLRPRGFGIHSEKNQVIVRNSFQPLPDRTGSQSHRASLSHNLVEGGGLAMLDRILFLPTVRTLLGLLGIFDDLVQEGVRYGVEPLFEIGVAYFELLDLLFTQQDSAAVSAGN